MRKSSCPRPSISYALLASFPEARINCCIRRACLTLVAKRESDSTGVNEMVEMVFALDFGAKNYDLGFTELSRSVPTGTLHSSQHTRFNDSISPIMPEYVPVLSRFHFSWFDPPSWLF